MTLPRLALCSVVLFLGACTANTVKLTVESEIPVPLVSRIPLTVGSYYEPELLNYIYEENSEDRQEWRIESGNSQAQLFDQILPHMFQQVVPVTDINGGGAPGPLAGIIAPQVSDMQFAMPRETKTDLYEAWVKYNIRLFEPGGQLVATWPVTGYGKASQELLESRDDGLNEAINLALRDAGAKLALEFDKVDAVREWLAARTGDCEKYAEGCK